MTNILVVFFILAFIGVMFLVLAGFAFFAVRLVIRLSLRGSGWAELAQHYAAGEPPAGQEFAWQTIRVGSVRYRHCARVIVAPQGLWLSNQLTLTKFPPLFIPWNEVKGTQRTSLYAREAVQLSIGEPSATTIAVYAQHFEAMSPYVGPCP